MSIVTTPDGKKFYSAHPQGFLSADQCSTYCIQSGDTLAVIADKLKVKPIPGMTNWQRLAGVNGIANANVIKPDIYLWVPRD